MGFDAGTVVEPLDWTFVKITGNEKDQGTIKEPTDRMIDEFFSGLNALSDKLAKDLGADKAPGPESTMATVATVPDDSVTSLGIDKYLDELNKLAGRLCSGSPSATQLKKLPLRRRMPFFIWLIGELRPNLFGAGTTPTPDLRLVKPA